jgi:diguanylate cyclase (GGDEF)-like protein/PAS domain S-box-containing protein
MHEPPQPVNPVSPGSTEIAPLQRKLLQALWGSGDSVWGWQAETDIMELATINDADSAPTVRQASMLDYLQAIHPDDLRMVMIKWNSHLFNQSENFDVQFRIQNGSDWHWMRKRGRAVSRNGAGLAVSISGTAHNISEQHQDRRNLELLVNVFDNASEGMCILSASRHIIDSNGAFSRLFGLTGIALSGNLLTDITQSNRRALVNQILDRSTVELSWQGEFDFENTIDNATTATWINVTAMFEKEVLSYFIITANDITERKNDEAKLRQLANFDSLTGSANRAYFETRLNQSIQHAYRLHENLALVFIDLDRFKQINDTMGHKAGDDLLQEVARRFEASVRTTDLVGRWGGDEFVILLTTLNASQDALRVANKIRDAILVPMMLNGESVTISASIGVALFPQDANSKTEMLERADAAMYQAKSGGRNAIEFYQHDFSTAANHKLTMEMALRGAIKNDELALHYQPKIDLNNKAVKGMEALLRWTSPTFGSVSPAEFIPLAEESDLILLLGHWVLEEACRQIRRWQGTALGGMRVAVNVSARQLHQPSLFDEIQTLLQAYEINPHLLEIELTESCLLADVAEMTKMFNELHAVGITIAIDDFGTGYSSLAYLKDLPINTLKVDQAFVCQIGVDKHGDSLVRTIVTLAKNLNLRVVAEGVETLEQEIFLKTLGCDDAQGYYYFKPLAADDLEKAMGEQALSTSTSTST